MLNVITHVSFKICIIFSKKINVYIGELIKYSNYKNKWVLKPKNGLYLMVPPLLRWLKPVMWNAKRDFSVIFNFILMQLSLTSRYF